MPSSQGLTPNATLDEVIEAINEILEILNEKLDMDVGNKGGGMQLIWTGTQAQYDALPTETKNAAGSLFFIIAS